MAAAVRFLTEDEISTMTGIDVQTVHATAVDRRIGYSVEGQAEKVFPPDYAARLLMALQPHAYVLRSTAARRIGCPPGQIEAALVRVYGPDLAQGSYAPVIEDIGGPEGDALYTTQAMQRAWKAINPEAEIASRQTDRAFVSLELDEGERP